MTNDQIKIQNLTRRMLELSAPHATVCKALGRCLCHRGTGAWACIHLAPHGTQAATQTLPAAWALSPTVQAAVRRGACKVHYPHATTAPASAPAPKAARRRGAKE